MISRVIGEMELIPRRYGVAFRDINGRRVVCYPIPLNWIVGWSREMVAWIRHGPALLSDMERAQAYANGFSKGYVVGAVHEKESRLSLWRDSPQ